MHLNIACIGRKLPAWLETGIAEYQKRLPINAHVTLSAIEAEKRLKSTAIAAIIAKESDRLLTLTQPSNKIIALDERGKSHTTQGLAKQLAQWQQNDDKVSVLIGGADGLSAKCKQAADELWSLSPLTLPHGLARLLLMEQIYRAFSLLNNHPYHRE